MPGIDYSKFDHIDDSDDEAPKKPAKPAAAPSPAPAAPAGPVKLPEEHCRPLDDAPDMQLPDGDYLQFYQTKMTAPQRMQTLVHLWNSADQTERVEFLRHLIDLIGNPTITNRIKGGQEVLKDLDTSYYDGVTFPEKWIESFKGLAVDDKKVTFEKFFKTLDQQERGLVLGTLM
eukprot:gb/GFBE01001790.1/.p1 GENE.gb/GFBE01001790.1/~~gb/GFBE01001790.1/.p1  ORF type:complete len:174 (+),score=45.36 gb/GFBE01001790.1/:1-522(+)